MVKETEVNDKIENKTADGGVGKGVAAEAHSGTKDATDNYKEGVKERKAAKRDRHSAHHPGDQPKAYDSSKTDGDGSSKAAKVEINADHEVTSIQHPDGTILKFKYDGDGQLFEIEDGQGHQAVKDGTSWKHYDRHGREKPEEEEHNTKISVERNGAIVREYWDDGSRVIQNTDGTYREERRDHSEIDRDANGNITDVTTSDGKTRSFKYDDGNIIQFKDQDGDVFIKQPDGTFAGPDEQMRKNVTVDERGNVIETKKDGGSETHRPDGTTRADYPNGGSAEFDAGSGAISYTSPEGGTFTFDDNGGASYQGKSSVTAEDIARAAIKSGDPTHPENEPDQESVDALAAQIRKANPKLNEPYAADSEVKVPAPED